MLSGMFTALDAAPEQLDPDEQTFVAEVREHGWFHTNVFAENGSPGFSYTTGWWINIGQPEVVAFGMKSEVAHAVLWDLFRDAKAGGSVPTGLSNHVFANIPAYLFPVAGRHYPDHLGWSRWFYGGDTFPCLHLVWSDRDGRFPWQSGFDPTLAGLQPDLTENGWLASLAH